MTHAQLLKAISSRTDYSGIVTADTWLRSVQVCLDGRCPTGLLDGITKRQWNGWLKAASQKLTYTAEDTRPTGTFRKATDGHKLPPHTIAVFPAIITTTKQDRDGDILETAGAELDPSAPLLWQHLPDMPIGRLLSKGQQNTHKLTGKFAIAGTALGQDAALLAEHGALRISHGFKPSKWEPLEDGAGFHILEFKIMEVSLVSIPANPDAVIEAFSREKLSHPLVKAWAGAKFKERPTIEPVGIDIRNLPAGTIILGGNKPDTDKACTCSTHTSTEQVMPTKAAIAFTDAPVSKSETWDANAAVKGVREWAGVNEDEPAAAAWKKYGQAFALLNGDADKLTSYELPYKQVEDGKLAIVPKAVSAAIGALNGGRGKGMDISDTDRKGAYAVLVKAYKKAYPDGDVPELKSADDIETKGVYVEFENSWDDIRSDLCDSLLAYLMGQGVCGSADSAYIVDMFPDHAIVSVNIGANAFYGPCNYGPPTAFNDDRLRYYVVTWAMGADEEPSWTGEPQKVEITPQIQPAAERALRDMSIEHKAFLKDKHVTKLAKAMGHLDDATEHDDATAATKKLSKGAHTAVKAVHDAHEKGVVTAMHKKKLAKAMGYCSAGAEHEDATPSLAKSFKAAHKAVSDVVKDAGMGDMGEAATAVEGAKTDEPEGTKAGAKFSAANSNHLKSAFHHLKAAATHVEATRAVSDLAGKAASKVGGLFATGGDAGSDYDEDGNFTGDDMTAYTATGGSADEAGKAGAAVSKESQATINEAHGLAKQVANHAEATPAIKRLAKGAMTHLKAVAPIDPDANNAQDDDDGDMSFHGGNPTGTTGKTLGERLSDAVADARAAVASGDSSKWFDLVEAQKDIEALSESIADAKIEIAVMQVAQA